MTGVVAALLATASGGNSGGGVTITLSNQTLNDAAASDDSCFYEINSDGKIYSSGTSGPLTVLQTWISDAAQVGNYEGEITVTSGSLGSGSDSAGVWYNLGTAHLWGAVQIGVGQNTVIFTIQIRDAATHTVQGSATINITAQAV